MIQIGNFLYFFNSCFSTGSVLHFWNVYHTSMELTLRQHVFELHESITHIVFSVLNTAVLHNPSLVDSGAEPQIWRPPTKLIFNCMGVGALFPHCCLRASCVSFPGHFFLFLVFFRVIGKVLKAVFLDLVFNLKVKFCIFFQTCI